MIDPCVLLKMLGEEARNWKKNHPGERQASFSEMIDCVLEKAAKMELPQNSDGYDLL